MSLLGKRFIRLQYIRIFKTLQKSDSKIISNKLQYKNINLLSYLFSTHTHILYPWVSILSISCFLETDIREQQKYEKRTQKYVDNTVYGLRHEIKFEICVKNIIIIIQLPWHFFLLRQILKNVNMPRQKPQHLPTAKANFKCCMLHLYLSLNH